MYGGNIFAAFLSRLYLSIKTFFYSSTRFNADGAFLALVAAAAVKKLSF